jgi:Lon protease-like protein
MPSAQRILPLFPLNSVLFPGASIPLQIFEDRYKQMLQDCLDSDSRFGIVLIKSGREVGEAAEPHTIGTVAHIVQSQEIDGGRFLISATGVQRFEISEILDRRPYISARVNLLAEDQDSWLPNTEMEVVRQAFTKYANLVSGLSGGWIRRARGPGDPVALSYHIAETLEVDLAEKQSLLEESSASKRLEAELDILRRDADRITRRMTAEIMSRFGRQ